MLDMRDDDWNKRDDWSGRDDDWPRRSSKARWMMLAIILILIVALLGIWIGP